jgi:hypothetical protein
VGKKAWRTDEELLKELFTCLVGDLMDKMRLQHQFFLRPEIRPLRPDMVLIGPSYAGALD